MNSRFREIYLSLIQMSWLKLILLSAFTYISISLVFAVLYYMQPNSILNAQDNYLNYFFFSIQTMSTIGYGVLSPSGVYANILVVIQSIFGLFFTAIMTGCIFAKISKPNSKIRFSKNMLMQNIDNQSFLTLRVGNLRGNDIVQVSAELTVLIREERNGESFRRIHDLKLTRNSSPFFKYSWTLFHPIDQDSPLHNLDLNTDEIEGFSVLIIGHDGLYSSTIFQNHRYHSKDVLYNKRFEDIIVVKNNIPSVNFDKFDMLKEAT